MSYPIAELRAASDEELIANHDRLAARTSIGVSYYLDELRRRDTARSEAAIRRLTWMIAGMTLVVAVATVLLLLRG